LTELSVDNEVHADVRAAQSHMPGSTSDPLIPAHSEVNAIFYSADESAIISRVGSPVEIEANRGLGGRRV
jgi:hypothetical protein